MNKEERSMELAETRPEFIGAEGTEPVGGKRRSGEARQRDIEEQLDAALACTFPASDPVSGCSVRADCEEPE